VKYDFKEFCIIFQFSKGTERLLTISVVSHQLKEGKHNRGKVRRRGVKLYKEGLRTASVAKYINSNFNKRGDLKREKPYKREDFCAI
jgi:hypothetical protein